MTFLRSASILVLSAGALQAQMTTRPTTAQPGIVLVAGTDLVVDSIDLVVTRFGSGVSADNDRVFVEGLYVLARVTNRGSERWASRGAVGFSLAAGRDGEDRDGRRPSRGGVSVVPSSPGIVNEIMAPFGPFRAEAAIPGSLAAGESRMIRAQVVNSNRNSEMIFERDKYYSVVATIRARGETEQSNNRAVQVGRVDAGRRGTLVVRWDPIAYRTGARAAVQVNAPPR